MKPTILFQALRPGTILPTYGSEHAVGLDLYVPRGALERGISPGERITILTGLSVAIPDGYYGRIAPRSGLAHKNGVDVLAGVIDPDYRGEIGAILINHGSEGFAVRPGDRIAQLIFECADRMQPKFVDQLPATARGEGGFGSTG